MRIKKLLLELIEENRELRKLISPENYEKAQKYNKVSEYLKDFKLHVKKACANLSENGSWDTIIEYEPIVEIVEHGKNGSKRFKAINGLDLVSGKDLMKIRNALDRTIKLNNDGLTK